MSDLIDRLRYGAHWYGHSLDLLKDAADTIECLQRTIAAYEAIINDDGSLESHEECLGILTDFRDAYEKLGAVEALHEQVRSLQRTNEELVSATQLVLDERNDNKVIANLLARLSGALYDRTCPLCREKLEQELRAEDEFQDLETRLREQIAENERLRAAAITPEQREGIQHVLTQRPYTSLELAQADLLRELNTGGE